MVEQIGKKIEDTRFISLIWKALRAGYFELKVYRHNLVGSPQGSNLSPILANIFLDQLDKYVEQLKLEYDLGTRAKRTQEFENTRYRLRKAKAKGEMDTVKKLAVKLRKSTNLEDPDFKRLNYVRYADDWIIAIRGPYSEAKSILEKVSDFSASIGLKVSERKTKITDVRVEKALFLGTEIRIHRTYSRIGVKQRNPSNIPNLTAPKNRVIKKLKEAGFISKGRSTPKFLWLSQSHDQIISLYNAVFRGYSNYYSFVQNRSTLIGILTFYLKGSCAKLLAAKLNLKRQAAVYKKFGGLLKSPSGIEFIKPDYKMDVWDFKRDAEPVVKHC